MSRLHRLLAAAACGVLVAGCPLARRSRLLITPAALSPRRRRLVVPFLSADGSAAEAACRANW